MADNNLHPWRYSSTRSGYHAALYGAERSQMSSEEVDQAKSLAKRLKDEGGIDNPHALARWLVKRRG